MVGGVNDALAESGVDAASKDGQERSGFRLCLGERVGHLLRRAYQRHVMIFQTHLSEYKLTAAQYIALANLLEEGVCSQSDLARLTAIDHTTIRGIVSRLKQRGLLLTEVDSLDARKVTVMLTAHGKVITAKASTHIDDVSEETFNGIDKLEKTALKYLLRRVADLPSPAVERKLDEGASSGSVTVSERTPVEAGVSSFQLQLDDRVGYLLRRAYQRHVTIFQYYLNEFHLTAAQYIVLASLSEYGVCSQSDLVRHTIIEHASIRGIISRLKAQGLLSTEVGPLDARKVIVSLTPKGRKLTGQASARIDIVTSETFNGINEAEQVALKYLLRRIANIPVA